MPLSSVKVEDPRRQWVFRDVWHGMLYCCTHLATAGVKMLDLNCIVCFLCCWQFQSHQIFHVFVLAAAFVHLHGSSVVASHRLSFGDQCDDLIGWRVSSRHSLPLPRLCAGTFVVYIFWTRSFVVTRFLLEFHHTTLLLCLWSAYTSFLFVFPFFSCTTVWVKKNPFPAVFWNFFPNGCFIFNQFLHTY